MTSLYLRSLALTALAASAGFAYAATDWKTVEPVLSTRCYECHGGAKTKGDVDLKHLSADPKVAAEFKLWQDVQDTVGNGDMPPKKAHQLSEQEHSLILAWVTEALDSLAAAKAGDPGPVTMRRLTNAEYDCTVRDLTGHDYGLAKEFQTDGGGGEGFANTGDVLFISPQALDKYFSAARKIADNATVMPGTGIVFHEQHIGLRGKEQVKAQAEQSLYVWYQHKAEPYLPKDGEDVHEADYMLACWKYQHRDITKEDSLEKLAKDAGLSVPFMQNWWKLLSGTEPKSRFLDLTRQPWRDLPAPASAKDIPAVVQPTLQRLQDERRLWVSTHIQRQQQDADGLRPYTIHLPLNNEPYVHLCIGDGGDGNKGDIALVSDLKVHANGKAMGYLEFLRGQLKADREALAKLKSPPPAPAKPAVPAPVVAQTVPPAKPAAAPVVPKPASPAPASTVAQSPAKPQAPVPTAAPKPATPVSAVAQTQAKPQTPPPAAAPKPAAVAQAKPKPAPAPPAKPKGPPPLTAEQLTKRIAEAEATLALLGKHPLGTPVDPNILAVAAPRVITLPLPAGARSFTATCRLDLDTPDVDAATIQWKLAVGTAPDPTQVMPGVLTVWKINSTAHHQTMHDFEVMRRVFPDEYVRRLEEVARNYFNKAGPGVYYFSDDQLLSLLSEDEKKELVDMKKDWGFVGPAKLEAKYEPEYDKLLLGHLHRLATQVWRRPLTPDETAKLDALYADGRSKELDRESAAREVMVRVLVSPNFLFKAETLPIVAAVPAPTTPAPQPAPAPTAPNAGDHALSAWEVASRLSYFLWASMPDETLRQAAADGSLLKPEVLAAQTKRMLRDPKAASMAREFAGQWLNFNGFAAQSSVDEKKFPEFTPELRNDMQEEAVAFFSHLVEDDRSVADIVTGDYTFLNARLAKHYGIPGVEGDDFREVKVAPYHRGGLLGMGCVLTKTSRPNRTSPVLRGNFLYQVVLGYNSPPPPANVPKLPENALKPSSLREAMAQHRADKACAVCHDRFDPLGFAMEGFDPIGRFRLVDESGARIDDSGEMKGGPKIDGADGLRQYLKTHEAEFIHQFDRKLLGYSLGRQTLPSDKALLEQMQQSLKTNGGKLSNAVLTIVNSHQFLYRRSDQSVASNP